MATLFSAATILFSAATIFFGAAAIFGAVAFFGAAAILPVQQQSYYLGVIECLCGKMVDDVIIYGRDLCVYLHKAT